MNKAKKTIAIFLLAGITSSSYAATSIFDNFNDGVIDATKWQVILPFGVSQLVENNGYIQSVGRGILGTKDNVDANIQISGKFMAVDLHANPKISFRSDLSAYDSFGSRLGLTLNFSINTPGLWIESRWSDGTGGTIGSAASYSWQTGVFYDFQINDDGNNIEVFINGVSTLTGFTSRRAGDLVGFFSREASDSTARFDDISIQVIPEPSSLSLLLAGGAVLMAGRRRKQD